MTESKKRQVEQTFENNPYDEKVRMIVKILNKRLGTKGGHLTWLVAMDICIALDVHGYLS